MGSWWLGGVGGDLPELGVWPACQGRPLGSPLTDELLTLTLSGGPRTAGPEPLTPIDEAC
jgi:ribosomal protein S18 acetylase RimI-like enzyme